MRAAPPLPLLLAMLCLGLFPSVSPAQFGNTPPLEVRDIDKDRAYGWTSVDNQWVWKCWSLKVQVRANAPVESKDIKAEAWFFDDDSKLLRYFSKPPDTQATGDNYVQIPELEEFGQPYYIFFPIPPAIQTGDHRWRSGVIKIHYLDQTFVETMPRTLDPQSFDYTQKPALILGDTASPAPTLPGDNPATGGQNPGTAAPATPGRFSIRKVRKIDPMGQVWLGNSYGHVNDLIEMVVRITEKPSDVKLYARAYFYNADKVLLHTFEKPPDVQTTNGNFQSLPVQYEIGKDYSLYFPVIPLLEDRDNRWKTVIVVFGNQQTAVAASHPELDNFDGYDFKEKSILAAPEKVDPFQ